MYSFIFFILFNTFQLCAMDRSKSPPLLISPAVSDSFVNRSYTSDSSDDDFESIEKTPSRVREYKELVSNNRIMLWQISLSYEKPVVLRRHKEAVLAVALSSDKKFALTGSYDNTAILHNLQTNKYDSIFVGHDLAVNGLSIKYPYVITSSFDKTIRLWNIGKGAEGLLKIIYLESTALKAKLHESEEKQIYILANLWDSIISFDILRNSESKQITYSSFNPRDYQFLIDSSGRYQIQVGAKETIIRELKTGKLNKIPYQLRPSAISINAKEVAIFSVSKSGILYSLDLKSHKIKELAKYSAEITSIATTDDNAVAVGCADGTIALWDLNTNQNLSFKAHTDAVTTIAFSDDKFHLISGSLDCSAKIWHIGAIMEQCTFLQLKLLLLLEANKSNSGFCLDRIWEKTVSLCSQEVRNFLNKKYVVNFVPKNRSCV